MRQFDEKRNILIDPAHFRFILLDDNFVRFYNAGPKENLKYHKFCLEFDSKEGAAYKFKELLNEPGWFHFINERRQHVLVNTHCFSNFYVESKTNNFGDQVYRLVFFAGPGDAFILSYKTFAEAQEKLLSLLQ